MTILDNAITRLRIVCGASYPTGVTADEKDKILKALFYDFTSLLTYFNHMLKNYLCTYFNKHTMSTADLAEKHDLFESLTPVFGRQAMDTVADIRELYLEYGYDGDPSSARADTLLGLSCMTRDYDAIARDIYSLLLAIYLDSIQNKQLLSAKSRCQDNYNMKQSDLCHALSANVQHYPYKTINELFRISTVFTRYITSVIYCEIASYEDFKSFEDITLFNANLRNTYNQVVDGMYTINKIYIPFASDPFFKIDLTEKDEVSVAAARYVFELYNYVKLHMINSPFLKI